MSTNIKEKELDGDLLFLKNLTETFGYKFTNEDIIALNVHFNFAAKNGLDYGSALHYAVKQFYGENQ